VSPSPKRDRVTELFEAVLREAPLKRGEFLRDACGGDDALVNEVGSLVAEFERIEHPENTTLTVEMQEVDAQPGPHIPRQIGRYLVTRELGRGGMGVVFEARDPLIGRTIAIKTIRLDAFDTEMDQDWLQERLLHEARLAGALSHPGIVAIHDVGTYNNTAFIAMEYVDGPTLESLMLRGQADYTVAVDLLRQAAAALDYANRAGVVHRDVKPANIILHRGRTLKVTDFGIAKIIADRRLTGKVMGTPSYMSPEQIHSVTLDGRSDQFSLAVIAYEMLTHVKPFQADTVAALLHRIAFGERPSACAEAPALPPEVDDVFRRGLAAEPKDRYRTCSEFVDTLKAALLPQVEHLGDKQPTHAWRWVWPRPWSTWLSNRSLPIFLTLILLTLGTFGWISTVSPEVVLHLSVAIQRADSQQIFVVPAPAIPALVLHDHDRMRLRISSPEPGYLYVILEDGGPSSRQGTLRSLFPSADRRQMAFVPADQAIDVPPSGPMELVERGLNGRIWMVWCRKPVKDLETVESEPVRARRFLVAAGQARYQNSQPGNTEVTLTSRGTLLVRLLALDQR
jgi:serine/threonine protein kinase